jgi:antitoxin ParD1/3/4
MAGMDTKPSITVTESQLREIEEAVATGEFSSASEVVGDAMRQWRSNRRLGVLWDEGIASGRANPDLTMDEIKAEARRRLKQPSK